MWVQQTEMEKSPSHFQDERWRINVDDGLQRRIIFFCAADGELDLLMIMQLRFIKIF